MANRLFHALPWLPALVLAAASSSSAPAQQPVATGQTLFVPPSVAGGYSSAGGAGATWTFGAQPRPTAYLPARPAVRSGLPPGIQVPSRRGSILRPTSFFVNGREVRYYDPRRPDLYDKFAPTTMGPALMGTNYWGPSMFPPPYSGGY